MLPLILEGVLLGLGLAILLGPIFIALTQTSIEKGGKAGLTVGLGIWISDLLFILITYYFIKQLDHIIADASFKFWMGLLGGFILMTFGLGAMFKKVEFDYNVPSFSAASYFSFFMKGFLVNTVNPFTFLFWIGVISTYKLRRDIHGQEAIALFGSILLVIMITDSLKVLLAKVLRQKLKGNVISYLIKGAGVLLFVFGLLLIYRSS